ncbi:MAG: hypothetical protein J3K34DRAFT_91332 [Monoraphidium minutum]|nr:MAG: hypothetical protein J3K34DRAFT_91332 [Monoraphidium minutum]
MGAAPPPRRHPQGGGAGAGAVAAGAAGRGRVVHACIWRYAARHYGGEGTSGPCVCVGGGQGAKSTLAERLRARQDLVKKAAATSRGFRGWEAPGGPAGGGGPPPGKTPAQVAGARGPRVGLAARAAQSRGRGSRRRCARACVAPAQAGHRGPGVCGGAVLSLLLLLEAGGSQSRE